MLDTITQLKQAEKNALIEKEKTTTSVQKLCETAEQEGKQRLVYARQEAKEAAAQSINQAQEKATSYLAKIHIQAEQEAEKIRQQGQKNLNQAVAFIVERIGAKE